MKRKKSPRPKPSKKDSSHTLGMTLREKSDILQKLSILEDLLKKKDDKPLTFKEACSYLGYAPSYLYKLTYRKIIPHYKPTGKMIFFSKNELDQWIYSSVECRTKSNEPENVKGEMDSGATSSSTGSELQLNTIDPNQVDMFEKKQDENEILIEFPLKSRRKK
jgi:excisionase family DNA binding protein